MIAYGIHLAAQAHRNLGRKVLVVDLSQIDFGLSGFLDAYAHPNNAGMQQISDKIREAYFAYIQEEDND